MNNLNSLIIEGVVKGEPHNEEVGASNRLYFTVEVARYYKTRDGNDATELSQFKVVAYGYMSTLPLKDGMGVRIVGRLKQNTWTDDGVSHSEVQVVAEHIEIRKTK
jgi:single-stranded DNA-binding protein